MKREIIFFLITVVICTVFMIWKYNTVMALDMPNAIKWLLILR